MQRIVDTPAIILEKSYNASKNGLRFLSKYGFVKKTDTYWEKLGPGLITGAADDDPSGIATYSQIGAAYGFQYLWLSIFSFPLMSVVQEMCARIALVTGRGLAGNIKKHYPKKALYFAVFALFCANTLNIGADLGAMAQGVNLITPVNTALTLVVIGLIVLLLEIFLSYKTYAQYLKWVTLVLFTYVVTIFLIHLPFVPVVRGTFIPTFSFTKDALLIITAVLGTTISPYLFFWQTSQEVEEEILEGKVKVHDRQGTTKEEIHHMRMDTWSGMFFSNFVMFCIISVCAATLYLHGIRNIGTAAEAALALRPLAGDGAFVLFALGIIGTGFLAIPVLAGSTSYAFAESFGWKEGLYLKLSQARSFYGVIIISMLFGLLLNFFHIDPIKALIYSAVLNGIIAPIIIYFIVDLSDNGHIMGEFKNSLTYRTIGYITFVVMAVTSIATIISLFV